VISLQEHSTTHRHAQVDDALIKQQTRQIRRGWPSTVAATLPSLDHNLLSAAAWPDHAAAAARPAAGQTPLLRAVGLHGPARS
jgi:hypothetical protein